MTVADTLDIDTLGTIYLQELGQEACDVLTPSADSIFTDGFFEANPLLHAELQAGQQGISATPVPYMPWRDDWVTGTILVCFFLLVFIVSCSRQQIVLQIKNFFYNPSRTDTSFAKTIAFRPLPAILMELMLCLMGGFMAYSNVHATRDIFLSSISTYLLLLVYIGCFAGYFVLRRLLANIVDWVFFTHTQHQLWIQAIHLFTAIEAILVFAVVSTFVYFGLSLDDTFIALFCVFGICELLLALKCFTIFFGHFHCLLHFFSYLCTLEAVPFVILLKTLVIVTDNILSM